MRRLILPLILCSVCVCLSGVPQRSLAQRDEANQPNGGRSPETEIHVMHLANASAAEIQDRLEDVAGLRGIQLSIDNRTNCLILSGDPQGIEAIQALCHVLDEAPRMIDTEIVLYELRGEAAETRELDLNTLQSSDDIRAIRRIRLQSLENQMTTIQLGEMVPVKTGESFSRGSGPSQAIYQMENLGTLVTYTARVSAETITMELAVETTRLRVADESQDELGLSAKTMGHLQTTVNLRSEEPTIVGDFTATDSPADTRFVVLVTAETK